MTQIEQMLEELTLPPDADALPAQTGGARPPKLRYTHEAMVDLIIADPGISQNELAARFGYSASWVSTIMCSDAFQAKLAERRGEIVDPQLRSNFELQLKGLMSRSMEILAAKLEAPPEYIPDQLALRTLELSTKALGYGAREQATVQVNVTNHLDSLGGNLVNLLRQKRRESETLDAEVEKP